MTLSATSKSGLHIPGSSHIPYGRAGILIASVLLVLFAGAVARAGERRAPLVKDAVIGELEGAGRDERETILRDILRTIQTKPGTKLNLETWNNDLKRLLSLSRYTISGRLVPVSPEAVRLIFDVEVRRRLREIVLEGVGWTEEEELRAELPVAVGDYIRLDRPQIRHIRRVVQRYFADLGYIFASAEISTEEKGEGLSLEINVRKGPLIINRRIEFIGNTFYSRRELLRLLTNRERTAASFLKFWEDQHFQKDALGDDIRRLRIKYAADGFLDARVIRESVRVDPVTGDCSIKIRIEEGPRYRITGTVIRGNRAFATGELLKLLKTEKGSYYDHEVVIGDVGLLKDFYFRHAYAEADVDLKRRSPKAGEVTLVFEITENLQITVDEIEIRGNWRTREPVIRRELSIYPNEVYPQTGLGEGPQAHRYRDRRGENDRPVVLRVRRFRLDRALGDFFVPAEELRPLEASKKHRGFLPYAVFQGRRTVSLLQLLSEQALRQLPPALGQPARVRFRFRPFRDAARYRVPRPRLRTVQQRNRV